MWNNLQRGIVCFFGTLLLAGCAQDPSGRQAVSGTVNFKEKPLEQGVISFEPASKEVATSSGAIISNGTFSIPADKGLIPGEYIVRISAGDAKIKVPEEMAPGETGPPAKELIPPEYNVQSKQRFEVKPNQENTYNVNIP